MDNSANSPRILLAEDEVAVRQTLVFMLEAGGYRAIPAGTADDAPQLLSVVPDIKAVVTDVQMAHSSLNGLELAHKVWEEHRLGVVVISGRMVPSDVELPPGIHFVAKPVHQATLIHLVQTAIRLSDPAAQSPSEVTSAAGGVDAGIRELTGRQREVLQLLVQGKSNREIAGELSLSENTVRAHLLSIFRILGVSNRTAAVVAGLKLPISG